MNSDDATAPPQNKITELPFFSAPIPDADLAGGGRRSVSEITLPDTDPFRSLRLHELPPASTNGHLDTAPRSVPPTAKVKVDRALVRALQKEAAELLRDYRSARDRERHDPKNAGRYFAPFTEEEEREFGRETITGLVKNHVQKTINSGGETFTIVEEEALIKAIFDAQFNLGPLQELVEEPHVTDIFLNGAAVYVKFPDGHYEHRDPVVDTPEELLEWMGLLASRADNGGRPFSRLNPSLRLTMRGGHRLSVMGYSVKRPSVAIRIHRLKNIALDQLAVEHRMMPIELATILSCAVRGGASVVTGGGMGFGKTTFTRALANALPLQTRIGIAETERELFIDELPGREDFVVDAETILGGGERGADGELAGSYTLSDILYEFVRQQLDYMIVGEVAGHEILALLKALQTARGGLSTTHAYTARGVVDRLVNLATEPPMNATVDYVERQLAEHIDLIVQLGTKVRVDGEGSRTSVRYVDEVVYVEPGDDKKPSFSTIYRGYSDGTGEFGSIPQPLLRKLLAGGFKRINLPSDSLRHFDEERDLYDDEEVA